MFTLIFAHMHIIIALAPATITPFSVCKIDVRVFSVCICYSSRNNFLCCLCVPKKKPEMKLHHFKFNVVRDVVTIKNYFLHPTIKCNHILDRNWVAYSRSMKTHKLSKIKRIDEKWVDNEVLCVALKPQYQSQQYMSIARISRSKYSMNSYPIKAVQRPRAHKTYMQYQLLAKINLLHFWAEKSYDNW